MEEMVNGKFNPNKQNIKREADIAIIYENCSKYTNFKHIVLERT